MPIHAYTGHHRRALRTSGVGRPTSEARQRLRSASLSLIVRRTRLSTVDDRAFPVAGLLVWNALPELVTSVASLHVFRNRQLRPISSGVATPKDHHPRRVRVVSLISQTPRSLIFTYLLRPAYRVKQQTSPRRTLSPASRQPVTATSSVTQV